MYTSFDHGHQPYSASKYLGGTTAEAYVPWQMSHTIGDSAPLEKKKNHKKPGVCKY